MVVWQAQSSVSNWLGGRGAFWRAERGGGGCRTVETTSSFYWGCFLLCLRTRTRQPPLEQLPVVPAPTGCLPPADFQIRPTSPTVPNAGNHSGYKCQLKSHKPKEKEISKECFPFIENTREKKKISICGLRLISPPSFLKKSLESTDVCICVCLCASIL